MDGTFGFQEVEHTADWALKVWAPDLLGMLTTAVDGMYQLMELVCEEGTAQEVSFSVKGFDSESLLVEFLSEVLYYAEMDSFALIAFSFSLDGYDLQVKAASRKILSQKKEIKAVTYHNLKVIGTENGLETVIIFDV